MLKLRRPSDAARTAALAAAVVAAPHAPVTTGPVVHEETIGWGLKRFERARLALRRLEPFAVPGTELVWDRSLEEGTRLVILGRRLGLWTAGPVEVTRVDEGDRHLIIELRTLEGHPLRGEERFTVERHLNGIVRFRIEAVSRPATWWAILITPALRFFQRRFRHRAIGHLRDVTGAGRATVAR
ncbi:MAG: DUF1990 family protein [Acidimicrobiia bacterium]|jgi:uncharacterized protein (UPF0548 family)|nr:MAG: DUF1990 family protein [Acidimicrobiia bacterium]